MSAAGSYKATMKTLDLDSAFIFMLHEICIETFDNLCSSVSDSEIHTEWDCNAMLIHTEWTLAELNQLTEKGRF